MGASRRGEREPGKSDQIDARAIARAVLREGIERFPAAFLDEQAVEIRLLCDHREILVAERTRLINRLRWNLVVLDPELEAKVPSRKLDYPGQLQRITRRLRALPQTARVRIAREQVKRIAALAREAEALKRELRDLRDDRSGWWSRAEMLRKLRDIDPDAVQGSLAHLERLGLLDRSGARFKASAGLRYIDDTLDLIGI